MTSLRAHKPHQYCNHRSQSPSFAEIKPRRLIYTTSVSLLRRRERIPFSHHESPFVAVACPRPRPTWIRPASRRQRSAPRFDRPCAVTGCRRRIRTRSDYASRGGETPFVIFSFPALTSSQESGLQAQDVFVTYVNHAHTGAFADRRVLVTEEDKMALARFLHEKAPDRVNLQWSPFMETVPVRRALLPLDSSSLTSTLAPSQRRLVLEVGDAEPQARCASVHAIMYGHRYSLTCI